PLRGNGVGEIVRGRKAAAQRAVGTDESGIAELADRAFAVLLAAAPEITAGEPAKYRRPPGMRAFALQGQKYLFDGVAHQISSRSPAQLNAFAAAPRRWPWQQPSRH